LRFYWRYELQQVNTMTANARFYNWGRLPKEVVRPGVSRCGFRGDDALIVMNWLESGMETKPHSHGCEQIVYIEQGQIRFHIGENVTEGGPASLMSIPPNVKHYGGPFGYEPVVNLDVFSPIREGYRNLVEYQLAAIETEHTS
jgi:quercetin dioxygenase-like cupin family protein